MNSHSIYIGSHELDRLPENFISNCEQVSDDLFKVQVLAKIEADALEDEISSLRSQLDQRNAIWLKRYEKAFDAVPSKQKREFMLPPEAFE